MELIESQSRVDHVLGYELLRLWGILKTLGPPEVHQKALLIQIKNCLLAVSTREGRESYGVNGQRGVVEALCHTSISPITNASIFSFVTSIQIGPDLTTKERGLVRSRRQL